MLRPAVEACVVTGASLRQPLSIMLLSVDAVKLASDLAERERLNSEFAQHLDAINASLDPYEQLSCLVLLMTPWNVDNNLITPTFKIKRNSIKGLRGGVIAVDRDGNHVMTYNSEGMLRGVTTDTLEPSVAVY